MTILQESKPYQGWKYLKWLSLHVPQWICIIYLWSLKWILACSGICSMHSMYPLLHCQQYIYSNEKSNRTHYNKNKWISLVNIYVGLMFWSLSIHLVCILFLTLKFDAWSLISDIHSSIVLQISCIIILIVHTYCSSLLCSKHIFFV